MGRGVHKPPRLYALSGNTLKGVTIMRNWKTTLVGAIAGGLVAIQPLLATGTLDIRALITGFALAALGVVAKDFNVSGEGK